MRISDWSSDVCSSDLRNRSKARKIAYWRSKGEVWGMTSPSAIDAAVDDPLKVEDLASKKSAAQEARKAHLLLQPHFLSPTPKCAPAARKSHQGRRFRLLRPLNWITTLRSEEHTSELQSLMRISYAVFFLNKKKVLYLKKKHKQAHTRRQQYDSQRSPHNNTKMI